VAWQETLPPQTFIRVASAYLSSGAVASGTPVAMEFQITCFVVQLVNQTHERIAAGHITPAGPD
jgi:hypothetical protein